MTTSRLFTVLSLAAALQLGGLARAQVVPLQPPPDASVVAPQQAEDLWRLNEAALKGRFMQKLLTTDGGGTPGMDLYDVTWYGLELNIQPANAHLYGNLTMRATVTGASLRDVDLHLAANMVINQITSDAGALSFTRAGEIVTVTLSRDYATGEEFTFTIAYDGNPAGDAFGWSSVSGQYLVWTLSEPYGARTWWPCKDLNIDKADSTDVSVTAPSNLIVVSNGTLVSQQSDGATVTYHWHESHPICTYLVSFAAHPYAVFSEYYHYSPSDSMEIRNYAVPAYLSQAQLGYAITPTLMGYFADAFGEYPFLDEKYGHAAFTWGGGMEHQTCASMAYNYFAQTFIAHELAHQWWGDMVTCADFHDIWLNEGFATWSEAYFRQRQNGAQAYRDYMDGNAYYGPGTVYVEDPNDFGGIFNYNLTYQKASWVVHMLRGVVGDEDFFAGLALYRQQHEYGTATTEDLQAAMESTSGMDLGPFFQEWIHGEYYPVYEYSYATTPQGGQTLVQVRIEQVQSNTGVFTMPIELAITSALGGSRLRVMNDRRVQNYSFLVGGSVAGVELDPDHWILKEATQVTPTDVPAASSRPLLTAYPNPFNPNTKLRLVLPRAAAVDLNVYDVQGRLVRTLLHESCPAGETSVRWDGVDLVGHAVASGTYYARLVAGGQTQVTPLVLVR